MTDKIQSAAEERARVIAVEMSAMLPMTVDDFQWATDHIAEALQESEQRAEAAEDELQRLRDQVERLKGLLDGANVALAIAVQYQGVPELRKQITEELKR